MHRDDDDHPPVPAHRRRTWAGLSWSEKRAVLRAARRGQSHPDPAVGLAARTWAREVLAPKSPTGHLVDAVLTLLTDPWGAGLGLLVADRRAARRISRASSPADPEPTL